MSSYRLPQTNSVFVGGQTRDIEELTEELNQYKYILLDMGMNVNQKRLRILQGLMGICLLFGIGVHIANGRPLVGSIFVGGTIGGTAFIPLAAILLIYWGLQSSLNGHE